MTRRSPRLHQFLRRHAWVLLLILGLSALCGCESLSDPDDGRNLNGLPWNTPTQRENGGMIGAPF